MLWREKRTKLASNASKTDAWTNFYFFFILEKRRFRLTFTTSKWYKETNPLLGALKDELFIDFQVPLQAILALKLEFSHIIRACHFEDWYSRFFAPSEWPEFLQTIHYCYFPFEILLPAFRVILQIVSGNMN